VRGAALFGHACAGRPLGGAAAAFLVAAVALAVTGPVHADQDAPALDGLFERLQQIEGGEAARRVSERIWEHWRAIDDPDTAAALEQGIVALQMGSHARAEARFDEVVAQAPGFAEGWNKRATARFLRGDMAGAAADIRRVLQREPRHFGALSGLGLVYMELERYAAAIQAFERALALNPHLEGTRRNIRIARERLREGST
jgi:tetratricopeptide (TPR) repeat protein